MAYARSFMVCDAESTHRRLRALSSLHGILCCTWSTKRGAGVFKVLFSGAHSTQHFEQGAYFWCLSRWFLCVYKWTHISPPIFFLYYFQRVMPSNEVIVNMNNIATFSYGKFTPYPFRIRIEQAVPIRRGLCTPKRWLWIPGLRSWMQQAISCH